MTRALRSAALALTATVLAVPVAFLGTAEAAQPRTWNFDQIRIGRSQAAGRNGAGVTVAVIDTWIDRAHPDFGGRVMTGADCTGGSCKAGNAPADRCEAHGTHVAGTVAGATYGVAPQARILPIRVLRWQNNECTGTSGDLALAIRYAVSHGARVVNVSAGAAVPMSQRDSRLDAAVAEAAQSDVLVVFAAGNQSVPVTDTYGGNALIVAATRRQGGLASYSQYGAGIDLAAPGGDATNNECTVSGCVVSAWSDGTHHQYAALAGTSMAAPHVSGVAALLFSQRARTRADVVKRLRDTARPLANAGDGLIDASAALGVASAPPPAATKAPAPSTVVTVKPRPKPQARTTTPPPPKPTAKATPTPTPRATPTSPSPVPSVAPTPEPQAADPPLVPVSSRTVPVALAAGLLAVVAAGTVGTALRR
jgi:subtilisin family serine protease